MSLTKRISLSISILLFFLSLKGQHDFYCSYIVKDGMTPGFVNDINSDSLGYLWISCRNGLSRFDGRNFQAYYAANNNPNSLAASEVFATTTDFNGNVWAATSKGLSRYSYKSNNFQSWTRKDGLTAEGIHDLAFQNDSILWLAHWFGLDRINIKNWNVENIAPFDHQKDTLLFHRSPNRIRDLKISPFNSVVYASHRSKISFYDPDNDSLKIIVDISTNSEGWIQDFNWLNERQLLILSTLKNEYFVFDLDQKQLIKKSLPFSFQLLALQRDRDGTMYALDKVEGPKLYPFEFEKQELRNEEKSSSSLLGNYLSIFKDNHDNLWCGRVDGLELWKPKRSKLFVRKNLTISDLVFDPENESCITLSEGNPLLWKYKKGQLILQSYDFGSYDRNNFLYSHFHKAYLNLTKDYLNIFKPSKKKDEIQIHLSETIPSESVRHMTEKEDKLYFSVNKSILRIENDGTVDTILTFTKDIFNFLVIKDDEFYFSCIGSLYHFEAHKIRQIYKPSAVTRARGLVMVGDTSLWFTQIHEGLIELDIRNTNFHVYGVEEGISSQILYSIDRQESSLLIPAAYCFYEFDLNTKQVRGVYQNNEGYKTFDLSSSIHLTNDEHYLTTTGTGILVHPCGQAHPKLQNLRMSYLKSGVQDKIYNLKKNHSFHYRDNDIYILLEAAYFGHKNELEFSYRLNGKSSNWVSLGSIPELNFINLPPRQYEMDIKVQTLTGEGIEIKSAIHFQIEAPFWQKSWFKIMILTLLVFSIYIVNKRRIAQVTKQYELDKKFQNLENNALKSQMNPHFLFNTLNGIRTLIKLKEETKAVKYIQHLSKMLRDTLIYHEEHLISLTQEIEMAKNYLELAKLRFGDKLNWKITISSKKSTSNIKLPPFILQPLIENAIWHGIKHIEGSGMIHIELAQENGQTIICVRDNGVGLVESAKIQEGKVRTRSQLGLILVKKRLKSIHGILIISDRTDSLGVEAKIKFTQNEQS